MFFKLALKSRSGTIAQAWTVEFAFKWAFSPRSHHNLFLIPTRASSVSISRLLIFLKSFLTSLTRDHDDLLQPSPQMRAKSDPRQFLFPAISLSTPPQLPATDKPTQLVESSSSAACEGWLRSQTCAQEETQRTAYLISWFYINSIYFTVCHSHNHSSQTRA